MKAAFAKLGSDFFSTIIFVVLYFSTGNVLLATVVAVLGAIGQFIYAKVKGQRLDVMSYASTALVVVLGGATLLTNDPRFMLVKPSIGHFAVGAIMLRRDWMLRYVPAHVAKTIPERRPAGGLFMGGADVRARRRRDRGGADRRHEAVDGLRDGGRARGQDRGPRRAIPRVPALAARPDAPRRAIRRDRRLVSRLRSGDPRAGGWNLLPWRRKSTEIPVRTMPRIA